MTDKQKYKETRAGKFTEQRKERGRGQIMWKRNGRQGDMRTNQSIIPT